MPEPQPRPRTLRRRLRRTAWIAVLVLVVLPALIVISAIAALRSAGVRQAILGRISAVLAADFGLAVTAQDFSPLWRTSGVELREVRVGAPGAAPIATARRVVARVELRSLRSRPLVVRSLEADGVRIDLRAPLPKLPETPAAAGAGPPLEIRRIALRNGEIVGSALAQPAAAWLRSWSVRGIAAGGSYRGGKVDLRVEQSEAILNRPGFGIQELQLAGRARWEEKKPLRIDGLTATGDGIRLTASGTVGLEAGAATAVRFDLDAEPRALAAGVPHRGRIQATGNLALPEIAGRLEITAAEIPAEALRSYLDPELYADLALAGTEADVKADATLGPGDWRRIAGTAELAWRRGGRRLARAEARLSPGAAAAPIVATVAAEILPGSPGRRSVQGTVRAASWPELARATADGVRAEIQLPDVRAALAEVRSLWPRLVPAPPAGLPIQGALSAEARLSGPLLSPGVRLDAAWLPQEGSRVHLAAQGQPRGWSGSAKVEVESLPLSLLGALAPGLEGTVTGTAELAGSPRGYRTRVDAATSAVAMPPQLQRLESGKVTADGTLILRPLSYRGTVSLDGAGLVALPQGRSTGSIPPSSQAASSSAPPALTSPTPPLPEGEEGKNLPDAFLPSLPLGERGRGSEGPRHEGAQVEAFQLAADGFLQASPLRWNGKLTLNGERAEMAGTGRADRFAAVADGTLAGQPLLYDGSLSLDASGVERPGTARVDRLQLSAAGKGSADLGSLAVKARIDADRVVLTEPVTEIRNLHLEAEAGDREVHLSALSGELPAGRTFNATGRVVTEPLLAEADLDLQLGKPVDAVTAADLTARLREGVVEVDAPRLDTASGPGSLHARIPLGALRQVPQLASVLDSLPGEKAQGPVSLTFSIPALDSQPLLAALGMEPRPERLRAGLNADLALDLAAPAAGRGEVTLSGLTVETPDGRVTAEGPAVLRLADGKIALAPVHLRIDGGSIQGAGIDLAGSAELARSWKPLEDPLTAAVTRISAEGSGTLDAALLDPYLQGGAARGSLSFSAKASGPPDRLAAEAQANGPGASFVWPAAGVQIEDPHLAVELRDGRWTIREGRLGVNGGKVELAGGTLAGGGLGVEAQLADVGYRLDFGIRTLLSGRVALHAPSEGRTRLSGKVVVERGVLDRDLNLDREVFTLLFKPPETPGTEETALAAVDLDLAVETVDGVRIKNNVGDLHASWHRLTVGGTLENPVIRGRVDIDPGGLVYAYGQTVRIEHGSLLFTGDPLTDPQIELTTTSSLQDPTITQLRGGGPLDLLAKTGENGAANASETEAVLAAGLTGYYGARFIQRLGESAGLAGLSVQPVLVFNEADPSARLTVGRDLSPNVALALSLDLRNAERQTYLLDVHALRSLPGLRLEGFTNDLGHEGASLQQAFSFGGAEVRKEGTGPQLHRLAISISKKGVSKRRIRLAIGLEKGAPLPQGTAFAVEVDAADFLHRAGYPDPRIHVDVEPVASRPGWADVNVAVEPGPKVSFSFQGDKPPRTLRSEITSLYRTDFYEATSIEDMRKATVRVFHSEGYLEPKVAIDVRRERPEDPDGPRAVTIRTEAGPRRSLRELAISGLPPDEERLAAAAFPSLLTRAELAAGLPDADARLLGALRGLGYAQAKIAGRTVEAAGSRLVVDVDPGPRRTVSAVEVTGVEGDERDRLLGLLPLRPGDPLRTDRIAVGALVLENDLRQRGYADAAAGAAVVPAPDRPDEARVVYRVIPGPQYRLAGVEVAGERWSRPAPLRRETGLAVGEPFTEAGVEEARNRLFQTGVFSRVDAEVDKESSGEARVSFSLAERPRFRLGYGARWESEVGTAGVLDFVDQNFLGRAVTLGLRGLYQSDNRSGRLYLNTGGVLGTRISLESYAEVRRRIFADGNFIEDRREAALQASRPLGESGKVQLYARYRTTHLFEIEPDPFFPLDTEIRLPYLGAQLLYDTRDDDIDPRSGLFTSLDLSGSGRFLGSDFEYVRLFAQAAAFRDVSLAGRPLTWAQAVRLGVAHPFGGQELISDERFFAGGPFSVRGYGLESLGPREILGDIVRVPGGEALVVINEELRLALPFDLTGLAFFDAGQVWATPGDANFDLAKSLGVGLRAHSPVGLLRLDAAFPLDRRPGEPSYKLYLGFGNAF